ncbi:MAG: DUF5979 domain-containing protein [Pseudoclavibacter sp.]|nr:DUF5979 domain-containing protein [Pseudoclavibacter sp.]
MILPRRRGAGPIARRRTAALAVLTALLAPTLSIASAAPTAADPAGIVVTPTGAIVRSDAEGRDQPEAPVHVDNVARASFAWDATNADPRPGDRFSIGLPAAFTPREHPSSFPMLDEAGAPQGVCELRERLVECTLGEGVAGKSEVKGTLSLLMLAVAEAGEDELVFDLNGRAEKVPSGTGEGVKPRPAPRWRFDDDEFRKVTSPFGQNTGRIVWSTTVAGSVLLDQADPAGIVLVDTLGPAQLFERDEARISLRAAAVKGEDGMSDLIRPTFELDRAAVGPTTTEYGTHELGVEFDESGTVATFRISGEIRRELMYQIVYTSLPASETALVQPGVVYENTIVLKGRDGDRTASFRRQYVQSLSATIQMKDGFGSFEVTKLLTGGAVDRVPADASFRVLVSWQLPEGRTPADYPGWEAPAENPTVLTVHPGKATGFQPTFPVGTVVTLREDLSAGPAPEGLEWGAPAFEAAEGLTIQEDGAAASFTVQNRQLRPVTLVNRAEQPRTGSLEIAKSVTGDDAETISQASFVFAYECTDGQSGTVEVRGDGVPVTVGTAFRPGTHCTVSEDAAAAAFAGYTHTAPAPQTAAIAEAPVRLDFVNHYERSGETSTAAPAPSSSTEQQPTPGQPGGAPAGSGPGLAQTGANGFIALAIAVAGLITAGGVLLAVRRHRERKRLTEGDGD